MAAYTIEDIELIRRKSGISYQEAVALLDYHNGNVARALIDLERNGRILPEDEQNRRAQADKGEESKDGKSGRGERGKGLLHKLYRSRIKVKKGDVGIANVSALFCIACALFAPHMTIAAIIASLVLGYKIQMSRDDKDFAGENLEKMVRSAAENVKSSVSELARGFSEEDEKPQQEQAKEQPQAQPQAQNGSFYQSNPAAYSQPAAYSGSMADIPTIQVPVKVESQDGNVVVESESDGHSSATIG